MSAASAARRLRGPDELEIVATEIDTDRGAVRVRGLDLVYIQAKKYAPDNKVSAEAVRAFIGSLGLQVSSTSTSPDSFSRWGTIITSR